MGTADALMIASGETRQISGQDSPVSANVYRIEDRAGSLSWERLNSISAVDAAATARAQAAAIDSTEDDAADLTVNAGTTTQGLVTDAQGYSYIVGTTAGDLGTHLGDGTDDLFLTKVDSEGNLVWQRSLGTAGSARGAAVTLAPNGEIVVAGTASSGDEIQGDMLVARFNAKGQELSNTVIRQVGAETASAVTVGRDGSIFVAGRASSGETR
ncbi:hypothetical protein [Novosphingobium panipatense]|uniref:hypothetical protein n=1 Tax=Novosphingobium panipatense TaxID=428991 RepID=UPI00361DDE3B